MNFKTAVKSCFQKYATFRGRAPRSEYWYFALFNLIAQMALAIVDGAMDTQFLVALYGLAVFLPNLAVTIRRLHDTDRSGWWILLSFLPLVGVIILLIWFCNRGTLGGNRFGGDPLDSHVT